MNKISRIENEIILQGRRNNQAWFEPRMGVIPPQANDRNPEVFIVVTLLAGDDIGPQFFLKTGDLGKTWTPPALTQRWHKIPLENDVFEEPWFGLTYHKKTGRLVAIGRTHCVQDAGTDTLYKMEHHAKVPGFCSASAYSVWDPAAQDFKSWEKLQFPEGFQPAVYYGGQRHECDDGILLIPGGYIEPNKTAQDGYGRVTVVRCSFDGSDLHYIEHGSVHVVEEVRGLHEPSLIWFQGRYFMTIRHDLRAYVTTGEDGLHFGELRPWTFDDGKELGNYNTQQHWLKHGDTLYLVYNRKSELNNGVFRSRAPLFMAEVDPDKLQVRRSTERIVFPEKGARMGNFCVADVTADESWIVTGEWLEGMFSYKKKGMRFYVESESINYIQYIGNLLLARVCWDG